MNPCIEGLHVHKTKDWSYHLCTTEIEPRRGVPSGLDFALKNLQHILDQLVPKCLVWQQGHVAKNQLGHLHDVRIALGHRVLEEICLFRLPSRQTNGSEIH